VLSLRRVLLALSLSVGEERRKWKADLGLEPAVGRASLVTFLSSFSFFPPLSGAPIFSREKMEDRDDALVLARSPPLTLSLLLLLFFFSSPFLPLMVAARERGQK